MRETSQFETAAALISPGPSLPTVWHDALYDVFDTVWAVNQAGSMFRHDYLCYTDTPARIIGHPKLRHFPDKTMGGILNIQQYPRLDGGKGTCSLTFPRVLKILLDVTGEDCAVYIFGMDHGGIKSFTGEDWRGSRTASERGWIERVWDCRRIVCVMGAARGWAESLTKDGDLLRK